MLFSKTKNKICTAIAIVTLSACSSLDVYEVKDFKGISHIHEGEKALIEWNINGCDSVTIQEFPGSYKSQDNLYYSTKDSKVLTFNAHRNDTSYTMHWKIVVLPEGEEGRISEAISSNNKVIAEVSEANTIHEDTQMSETGAVSQDEFSILPSFYETKYFSGILKYNGKTKPSTFRVVGIDYSNGFENIDVKAILLDEFGNMLANYFVDKNTPTSIMQYCKTGIAGDLLKKPKEIHYSESTPLLFSLAIENSAASWKNSEFVPNLSEFIQLLDNKDKLTLYTFNQNINTKIDNQSKLDAIKSFENINIEPSNGFNSFNKMAYLSIKNAKNSHADKKCAVLITYSPDNSSIIYQTDDAVQLAKENNIPVYIISVGNAIESFSLKYLSYATGGNYYQLSNDNIDAIPNILAEIAYAQKHYFMFKLPDNLFVNPNCNNVKTEIAVQTEDDNLTDVFKVINEAEPQYPKYQALAAFYKHDTVIQPDFYNNIKTLATTLIENKEMTVELIGHSSIEGDEDQNIFLSRSRAQAVRKMLLKDGVAPGQIRIRWEGSNKPIFYLQQAPWQQYYNRRVEVRWLDPEMLPYEIIAQTSASETEALKNVEKWEFHGYNAYYERYLDNHSPVYRVKIWGYPTLEEAEANANKIQTVYNTKCVVQ